MCQNPGSGGAIPIGPPILMLMLATSGITAGFLLNVPSQVLPALAKPEIRIDCSLASAVPASPATSPSAIIRTDAGCLIAANTAVHRSQVVVILIDVPFWQEVEPA